MADYQVVYEPSDDTYLMLDALAIDFNTDNNHNDSVANQQRIKNTTNTLEIGCGTGVSSIFLAKLLEKKAQAQLLQTHELIYHHHHIVTDINPNAIRIAKETASQNGINLNTFETHLCDLATPLLKSYKHSIDVLIFNPPYVPTPNDEVGSDGIEASWAGGTDGRLVIDRTLPQIDVLLSRPNGVAYMITVDDNKPEQIASIMMEKYGIIVQPFLRRRARNEFLTVLKMSFQH